MVAQGFGAADRVARAGDSMTGTLILSGATPLRITPGSPAAGKVLVSDASGNAAWGTAGVSAPLTLSSAQAAASILSLTNTTAAPSAPINQMTAAAAGDSTIGVKVAGDTQQRLLADSNGALTWGSGSAVGDVTLSRTAVGVIGTNGAVQAGTVQGGSAASGTLTVSSTSNATKGKIILGASAYDETNNRLGVGNAAPAVPLDVTGAGAFSGNLSVGGDLAVTGIGSRQYIRKTADQTVNNSITLVNDLLLVASVAANAIYTFDLFLVYDSVTATPDLKMAFTSPTSSTLIWVPYALSASATTRTDTIDVKEVVGSGTTTNTGTVAGSSAVICPRGVLRTAGTAGTLQFQFAQATATVENTVVRADSYLSLLRVG
jgi:hypothetical protein